MYGITMEYLELGATPCGENCEQVGPNYNPDKARQEHKRYIELLRKKFGEEPNGARLCIKSFPHDFGTYSEVVCKYDPDNEEATNYAFNIESHLPEYWEE